MVLKHASEIRFFVNLKYQRSTIKLKLGINYSMHDPVCKGNCCSLSATVLYGS